MPRSSAPLRVLVVDDERLICWSLAETLSAFGDRVIEAANGAAAIRALRDAAAPIDVVLLDYHLPDVRDLSLLEEVRRLAPGSRVIVMSAYGSSELTKSATALGASAVVDKPLDMHAVPALVHGETPVR